MELETIELKFLKKYIKNKKTYMVFGFDEMDQYNSIKDVNTIIKNICKEFEKNSIIFYFGELPNIDKPDIGYIISEIKNKRNDIEIIMLQSMDDENIEIPDFVSKILKIELKSKKKRGVNSNNKKPLGLTKLWVDLNKIQKFEKVYILSGNNVTVDEYLLLKELNINNKYFPLKRKFLGDSKTLIKKNSSYQDKIGVTHIFTDSIE